MTDQPASLKRVAKFEPSQSDAVETYVAAAGGSIFHTPRWLQAVAEGTGNRAHGLVLYDREKVTGWLPLTCMHSPLFGRALVSSGFAVGGGAIAANPEDAETLCHAAQELAQRLSVETVEVKGGAFPGDWEADDRTYAGFVADLADTDEAQLLAIPRKARAEVRKGLAKDLHVEHGRSEALRAAHYAIYARSVHNLGTPVFPRSLFEAVMDAFPEADITLVSDREGPVSAVLSLYHSGMAMPYWGGGLARARALHSNERMYYELMCHARQRGATRFDFGRSKTGTGPYRFKKNWGFEPEPLRYGYWTAPGADRRNLNPDDPKHAARVAAWRRLPPFLADRLGPLIARGLG